MTNATDALLNDLHLIASQGETPDGDGVTVNVQLWAERWVERLATPAGSASGEELASLAIRMAGEAQRWHVRAEAAEAEAARLREDAARLEAIAQNYWRLDPFDMPTPGGDDADVGWRVTEYYKAEPRERVVAEAYTDDPRAAIDAAIQGSANGQADAADTTAGEG